MSRLFGAAGRLIKTKFLSPSLARSCHAKSSAAPLASSEILRQTIDKFPVGSSHEGYTVTQVKDVDVLGMVAVMLEHDKTGAQHVHLARDDPNNTFGVTFRAVPMTDTGVSHILEHTLLCGSENYPVRDPFFCMLNRSLSTHMNAYTGSDITLYPFSTENQTDYYNLMSVYMDAVFKPRLRRLDFLQEGWRLEHTVPEDQSTPIIFKGIVFNEMKGSNSNPHRIFQQAAQSAVLPSHTYSINSGGESLAMPSLSHAGLVEFYTKHYHPSNSRFFTYGDLPLKEQLEFINKNLLSKCEKDPNVEASTEVPLEASWSAPREHSVSCRDDPMAADRQKQTTAAVSYCLGDIKDSYQTFLLSVVSNLLTDGESSPFYQSLIEANIGADFAPTTGLDDSTRNVTFSVGLEGIQKDDVSKVTQIVEDTFKRVVKEGFDRQRLDALLHKVELGLKHQTTGFGLNFMMKLASPLNHGASLNEVVDVSDFLRRFEEDLKTQPDLLQNIVEHSFVRNPHKTTVTMSPSSSYESDLVKKEEVLLKEMLDKMDAKQLGEVHQIGLELKSNQEADEVIDCLPMLGSSEIRDYVRQVPYSTSIAGHVPVYIFEQPTNHVTYFRARSDTRCVPAELKPLLPLFSAVVTSMGAGGLDYKEFAQRVDMTTAGLNVSPSLTRNPTDSGLYEESICFSSFCLDKNVDKMFDLWSKIFNSVDMSDMSRLSTLVRMGAANMASSLTNSGHVYAMTSAAAQLSTIGKAQETLAGLEQMRLMKSIAEMEDLTPVLAKLVELSKLLLSKTSMRCSLNVLPEFSSSAVQQLEKFLSSLPQVNSYIEPEWTEDRVIFDPHQANRHIVFDIGVNYAAMCLPTVSYMNPDFAPLRVMSQLLSNKFLHKEIREKGGAYGGRMGGSNPGALHFFSYRDPRSIETIETFSQSAEWMRNREITQRDMDESILTVFKEVDGPVAPGSRGSALFSGGISDDMKQEHRERLKAVTPQDLKDVAGRYLTNATRSSVIIGPTNSQIKELPDWKTVCE